MIVSILKSLEKFARVEPKKTALIEAGKSLTYSELYARVIQISTILRELDLKGKRVAIKLGNSCELAAIYLACLHLEIVMVPLSINLKRSEVESVFSEIEPKCYITQSTTENFKVKHTFYLDENPFESDSIQELKMIPSESYAAIFFTSGSTGTPKGIVHSEQTLSYMMDSIADGIDLDSNDRFSLFEAMTNASGFIQCFAPLLIGATTIISQEFSIDHFKNTIKHRPTLMSVMGRGNSDMLNSPLIKQEHFTDIRLNITGGDKISKDLILAFKKKTGCSLRVSYGMSEILIITVNKSEEEEKLEALGKAAKHTKMIILDQNQNEVKIGEVGELWVQGPNLMLGYWKDLVSQKETLIDGWLQTGDLVRKDVDGYCWFSGRIKQLIIREGNNISPFEIEEVLMKHPAVSCVGVIGIDDSLEGQLPKAFVELKPGEISTENELLAFAKERLEDYKVPVAIVILQKMPRTLSGKISREALLD